MAVFYPSIDEIYQDTMEKHTAGEIALLEELVRLPDDYNVYFQAHINCAHPDVIIEGAEKGILIIEVKDWNLDLYSYHKSSEGQNDKFGYLTVSGSLAKLSTPFEQVQYYKDELFEALSPELCAARLLDRKIQPDGSVRNPFYGVVKTCVFFACGTRTSVKELFGIDRFSFTNQQMYYDKFTACWTVDDRGSLSSKAIRILTQNKRYTQSIHEAVKALFAPSMEWIEQMKPIELTDEQNRFAVCTPGKRTRILGTPGSGKTIVIAQKAINCYRKKHQKVLILTYNITLKNYIRDKIAVNSRELTGHERNAAFDILHLDQFLPQMLRKYGLKGPELSQFCLPDRKPDWNGYRNEQMKILSSAKDIVEAYTTVLIDEAQDFTYPWFKFIDNVFVADQADYLIAADEKQNIYENMLDEKKLPRVSGFRGDWAKLKGNHRMTAGGYQLAVNFQQQFMKGKYYLDKPIQLDLFSIMEKRNYCKIEKFDPETIFLKVQEFKSKDAPISPNDICILTFSNYDVQKIDFCFRSNSETDLRKLSARHWKYIRS